MSLTNRPIGLDDGDDDTQYSAGTGIAISGANVVSVDGSAITADWGNLTGIPVNIDTDSTDDFDGEWSSLSNPASASTTGMTTPSTPQGRVSPFQVPTSSVSMVVP